MDANQFKAAIGGMSEADLHEVINALDRAREHAMQLKISARLPECAAFGAIAEDLEYGLGIICGSAPAQHAAETPNADNAQTGGQVPSATNFDPETFRRT